MTAQKREQIARSGDFQFGFKALADALGLTRFFEDAQSGVANFEDLLPFFEYGAGVFREDFFGFGEESEMDAGFAAFDLG